MKTPEEILDERIRNIPKKYKRDTSVWCKARMHYTCIYRTDENGISFCSLTHKIPCLCLCHLYFAQYTNDKLQEDISNIEPKIGNIH